jgi:hypothetical protein
MSKNKKARQEVDRFSDWMRDTVRTIHYADNERMSEAYDRVLNNYLEIKIYENKEKSLTDTTRIQNDNINVI